MKVLFFLLVLSFTVSGFARPEQVISIKDRLRYELWYRGLESKKKVTTANKQRLPEELSRPLRNF